MSTQASSACHNVYLMSVDLYLLTTIKHLCLNVTLYCVEALPNLVDGE